MAARSVQLRERAATDIEHAVRYYRSEAGADVALGFIDAIERTVGQIARSPKSGSLRFAYELAIPDLRVRPVARFPYLVFYVVGDDVIDVWRVPYTKRDIPSAIAGDIDDRFDDPTRPAVSPHTSTRRMASRLAMAGAMSARMWRTTFTGVPADSAARGCFRKRSAHAGRCESRVPYL